MCVPSLRTTFPTRARKIWDYRGCVCSCRAGLCFQQPVKCWTSETLRPILIPPYHPRNVWYHVMSSDVMWSCNVWSPVMPWWCTFIKLVWLGSSSVSAVLSQAWPKIFDWHFNIYADIREWKTVHDVVTWCQDVISHDVMWRVTTCITISCDVTWCVMWHTL